MTNLEKHRNEIASAIANDWEGGVCESFNPDFEERENPCEGCILKNVKCGNKEAVLAWLDQKNDE